MPTALHQSQRVEAVDGGVKKDTQRMVANAVKTEESGNQKDGNNNGPKIFAGLAPGLFAWLVWVNGLTQGFASIKECFAQFYPNCIDTGNWLFATTEVG